MSAQDFACDLIELLEENARDAGVNYDKTLDKMLGLAADERGIELLAEIAAASLALLVATAQDLEELQNETAAAREELEQAARAAGFAPRSEERERRAQDAAWVTPGAPNVPYRLIP